MHAISTRDLDHVHGGQMRPIAPSTGINIGVHIMTLLDHPEKTWQGIKDFLGVPPSGKPGQIYHPAKTNPDGSIQRGYFSDPPRPGPQVPTSQ